MIARRLLLLIAVLLSLAASGAVRKTTRPRLKVSPEVVDVNRVAMSDTIAVDSTLLVHSGYDKPLRSTVETMFITSRLDSATVTAVEIAIRYLDMKGRQLHERRQWVDVTIPPGETRLVTLPTWDRQQSFYYHRSRRPRYATATPYTVVSATVRAAVTSNESARAD